MKKICLLFAAILMVCGTLMAQTLTTKSEVGTIGTLDGRQAMVVDLGGTIGKVAVATRNVGAEKASDKMAIITCGTRFNLGEANDPEKNGLTDGWYVPSKAELEALKDHLTPNKGVHCVEWKVTDNATLYLPTWSASSSSYYGNYASSSREQVGSTWKCWIYEFFFYDSDSSFGGNDLEECDEQETDNCLVRPFHKLSGNDDGTYISTSFIDALGESHDIDATVVTNSALQVTWGEAGKTTWYVVTGTDVELSQGAICAGAVNLILADGAKLTATGVGLQAGIRVSGEGNSLTIYGQTAQSGQLVANGGNDGAGIGGGEEQSGSNITISGGVVTATGGLYAAGIGGGYHGSASNITITGGKVTANGDVGVAGIGGGYGGSASNITVATTLQVKADGYNPPRTIVAANRTAGADIAGYLSGKRYVIIEKIDVPTPEPIEVEYRYPVFNMSAPYNGIDEWKTATAYATEITNSFTILTPGWYVVKGADVQTGTLVCAGSVHIILADGAKLTATGTYIYSYSEDDTPGIQVSGEGNSLTVYSQSADPATMGQLIANGGRGAAGIGGEYQGSSSNITINGGIVTATGGDGAGIGGGNKGYGSNITINGGVVTATSKFNGAGIGGGNESTGSNITINGGVVTASTVIEPLAHSSCIGDGHDIIGFVPGSKIYISSSLIAKAGDSEETAYVIYNPGIDPKTHKPVDLFGTLAGKKYVTIEPKSAPEQKEVGYIDKDGTEQTVKADIVFTRSVPVTWGEADKTSWYVVTRENEQLLGAVCQGDVRLILADGAKLTTKGMTGRTPTLYTPGIQVSGEGNSLTIYGQSAQSGQLIALGVNEQARGSAGIGGGVSGNGSDITINGGTVTATGGDGAAGIGGGVSGNGSDITINGGTVTATGGGSYGAGIGGGAYGSASNITITGGTVTANGGGLWVAGIGGSSGSICSNISITGGTVTATGGLYAAGIGGTFEQSTVSDIFVSTALTLIAGKTENPTDVFENTGGDLASSLAYMRYVIVTDAAVCNITANQDPNYRTHYYSTFYSSKTAYTVPEGVTAYTGVVEGNVLRLTAIADGIIPAGEPVILRLTTEENTATKKEFALIPTTTTATRSDDNAMTGTDEAKTLGENEHALSLGQSGVGFYLWNGRPIGVNKSYLSLDGTAAGTKAVSIVIED